MNFSSSGKRAAWRITALFVNFGDLDQVLQVGAGERESVDHRPVKREIGFDEENARLCEDVDLVIGVALGNEETECTGCVYGKAVAEGNSANLPFSDGLFGALRRVRRNRHDIEANLAEFVGPSGCLFKVTPAAEPLVAEKPSRKVRSRNSTAPRNAGTLTR